MRVRDLRALAATIFHSPIMRAWKDDRAAQLAEFAIALPLLVFFVVGIFDFSSAFTLKQKLTNVARDAARASAGDPANDLSSPSISTPASVLDAFQIIQGYFNANNLNLCGITGFGAPSGLTWTASGNSNGCPSAGVTITVNRGYFMPAAPANPPAATCAPSASGGPNGLTVIATCVSIQYAYPWRFGQVATLLGNNDPLPAQITATAVALNEN